MAINKNLSKVFGNFNKRTEVAKAKSDSKILTEMGVKLIMDLSHINGDFAKYLLGKEINLGTYLVLLGQALKRAKGEKGYISDEEVMKLANILVKGIVKCAVKGINDISKSIKMQEDITLELTSAFGTGNKFDLEYKEVSLDCGFDLCEVELHSNAVNGKIVEKAVDMSNRENLILFCSLCDKQFRNIGESIIDAATLVEGGFVIDTGWAFMIRAAYKGTAEFDYEERKLIFKLPFDGQKYQKDYFIFWDDIALSNVLVLEEINNSLPVMNEEAKTMSRIAMGRVTANEEHLNIARVIANIRESNYRPSIAATRVKYNEILSGMVEDSEEYLSTRSEMFNEYKSAKAEFSKEILGLIETIAPELTIKEIARIIEVSDWYVDGNSNASSYQVASTSFIVHDSLVHELLASQGLDYYTAYQKVVGGADAYSSKISAQRELELSNEFGFNLADVSVMVEDDFEETVVPVIEEFQERLQEFADRKDRAFFQGTVNPKTGLVIKTRVVGLCEILVNPQNNKVTVQSVHSLTEQSIAEQGMVNIISSCNNRKAVDEHSLKALTKDHAEQMKAIKVGDQRHYFGDQGPLCTVVEIKRISDIASAIYHELV